MRKPSLNRPPAVPLVPVRSQVARLYGIAAEHRRSIAITDYPSSAPGYITQNTVRTAGTRLLRMAHILLDGEVVSRFNIIDGRKENS